MKYHWYIGEKDAYFIKIQVRVSDTIISEKGKLPHGPFMTTMKTPSSDRYETIEPEIVVNHRNNEDFDWFFRYTFEVGGPFRFRYVQGTMKKEIEVEVNPIDVVSD